jgi:hypothetical protein
MNPLTPKPIKRLKAIFATTMRAMSIPNSDVLFGGEGFGFWVVGAIVVVVDPHSHTNTVQGYLYVIPVTWHKVEHGLQRPYVGHGS